MLTQKTSRYTKIGKLALFFLVFGFFFGFLKFTNWHWFFGFLALVLAKIRKIGKETSRYTKIGKFACILRVFFVFFWGEHPPLMRVNGFSLTVI